jgi:hypothetical protein
MRRKLVGILERGRSRQKLRYFSRRGGFGTRTAGVHTSDDILVHRRQQPLFLPVTSVALVDESIVILWLAGFHRDLIS